MAENKTGPVGAGEIAEELPRPPILVVDDNEINRYTTRKTLERIGFPVVEAASGEAGLELLGLGSAVASSGTPLPWLVILDVHLPGLNGFEVCRRIKTAPASASVLVLHLSNHRTGSGDLVTGLESGADGYLTFPIDPPVLAAHVRSLFRLARAEKVSREAEERLRSANEVLECQVGERTSELTDALTALEVLLAERLALVARLVTAQEDERRRISRELHDEMGQLITGFGLQLKALENTIMAAASAAPSCSRENTEGLSTLEKLRGLTVAMGKEVHRIAVELRPTSLDDLGLVPALSAYVEEWGQRTRTLAEFEVTGLPQERLPSLLETTIYRIVQEALNNAAKYAVPKGATHVTVTLQGIHGEGEGEGQVQAVVEDNGPGFDLEEAMHSGRLGLVGMRERAELIGGTVEIESAPGEGTTVFLRLPLTGAAASAA